MIKQTSCLLLLAFAFYACKNNSQPTQKFIETGYMDSSVKPGDNFFLYVNGKWIDTAKIPATESGVGAFLDVYNRTKEHIKTIFDDVSKTEKPNGSAEQQVGDFYVSGMDTATIEKLGYTPIKPYLDKIDAITNAQSIMQLESEFNKLNRFFIVSFYIASDQKNSGTNIINFSQTGIGLPDRDYYFKTDFAILRVQKAYQTYMQKTFMLLGDDSATATKKATNVYALEKQMAASHRTNVELRDPQSNYNKFYISALDKKMPTIGWSTYLQNVGAKTDSANIEQPAYYQKLNELLTTVPIDTWKAYYRIHFTKDFAGALSSAFVNAIFQYGKTLSGQQQQKPRWERVYGVINNNIGDALGQLYVKKYFTEDAKKRMAELINNLQTAFETRITNLDWMSNETKVKAKDKLHAFLKKIGYTDKWKDYSKVSIKKNTYVENIISATTNEFQYQLGKLGKPVDKTEWGMTPPTINAYYNPSFNEIVFPAGILQFPFFDPQADDAINYGGIGMVIGHEMTHGFDDQGAQYDKDGNMKNWWEKEDSVKFVAKSKQVINLYNSFVMLDSLHINGALTTGENMADIGGIAIAYDAFKMTKQGKDTIKIDGFTPDQRFFISFAQIWREKLKPELERMYLNTDPHSPPMYRVLGPLQNFTPFYKAFNVQPVNKMYKPESERIKIW